MKGPFVDFILQVEYSCDVRTVVEKSVTALAAMGGLANFHTALFAQGLKTP